MNLYIYIDIVFSLGELMNSSYTSLIYLQPDFFGHIMSHITLPGGENGQKQPI